MPTKRPRHSITEVGPVEEALAKARGVAPDVDLRDLIVLGADAFVRRAEEREHDARRRAVARTRLIDRLAAGAGVDAGAAAEARERGYSRPL